MPPEDNAFLAGLDLEDGDEFEEYPVKRRPVVLCKFDEPRLDDQPAELN